MSHWSADFTPAYMEGWTVKVHHAGSVDNIRILAVKPTASHMHNWGALTAGTALLDQRCNHLQAFDNELCIYRFVVMDLFEVMLKHPLSTDYWSNKNGATTQGNNWRVRPWIHDPTLPAGYREHLWMSSQFSVWEDEDPRFDLYPMSSAQRPQGYIEFTGWKYSFERVAGEGQTDLWVDRWPVR